jgi:signal transduction histidine kinase/CheY-like chemotaxis protein
VDGSGNVVGVASLVQDVTERLKAEEERRRLEAQMLHAQKLESLGVLAGGIAHDFNNLLVGVLGNAGLALLELQQGHPARQTVEQIEAVAMRAAELTHQLLAYSGRGKFVIEPVSLSRLVHEMRHLLEVSVSKAAVVQYELPPELPVTDADATQMRQIVMNLMINASDALDGIQGTITVRTGTIDADSDYLAATYLNENLRPGRFVFLEVTDTGKGMDPATSARIFDPFFSTKQTGRGLGLAAVLGIVRGHHGTIRVYSEPASGTTFRVLLPPSGGAAAADTPPRGNHPTRLGAGTVLVVDDDETVRRVARSMLERHGFTVVTANDGVEGVEAFEREPDRFSLVLLDLTMPRMNGDEAFRAIKSVRGSVPVILSSGYTELDTVGKFSSAGLAGFVQKPFQMRDLVDKVFAALAVK